MKWLKKLLTKQDSVQLALQELKEAERSLLIAQSGQEYAASMVAYHSARIVRTEALMQTFLPYADFHKTAACLDNRRLGKQRVEVLQILRTLAGYTEGWKNHPAVLMWTNYEDALVDYGLVICREWRTRGFNDTCRDKIARFASFRVYELPHWIGNEAFHASHRSNLLRKDPDHYGKFGWTEGPDLPYVWPSKE